MARTMEGTIIGETKKASKRARPRNRDRTSPRAANVPTTVASGATARPRSTLLRVAATHWGSRSRTRYHSRDHPGGGNWRGREELKESGIKMRTGRER